LADTKDSVTYNSAMTQSPRRALITGITGQDGSYLADHLVELGYHVIGLVRRSSTVTFERIAHLQDRITLVNADLLDQGSLISALSTHRPHEVYNLAAQSYVRTSFDQPVLTGEVTGIGVARLLDSIRLVDPDIRFYQASSSEMFGNAGPGPLDERTPFAPRSPYGAAKAYAHYLTVNYRESYGLFACCGIAFNHESPRRGAEFLTRKITSGVANIASGAKSRLTLGRLDVSRDWGHSRDYVEAMHRLLQTDEPTDVVIATGSSHTIEQLVATAFQRVGLDWRDHVDYDATLAPPADITALVGNPTSARDFLDWTATTSFDQLVDEMVDADLARRGA
jgi:GDPmannose 4,6-dehydratase